jgi:hypothetical protein
VLCPLCSQRKARRACPALGQQICAICCATKRLTEIACPADCGYLTIAREHPSAAVLRQQQRDIALLMTLLQDFNQRQSEWVFVSIRAIAAYQAPPLQPLRDADVADALSSLAATSDTAARGVIYEHQPESMSAQRLAAAVKTVLTEAGGYRDSATERDVAAALRRIAVTMTDDNQQPAPGAPDAFLAFLARILAASAAEEAKPATEHPVPSRLIVP